MSINTAHASNGVLIHSGEYILLHSDGVTMEFSGQDNMVFSGAKHGRIYLTSHRIIFNNKKPSDPLLSFSAPFIAMSDVELEQPVFGANYIKGKVRAQPNGNFIGEVKFKLYFKSGGAIEYGQALLRAARTAQHNYPGSINDDPPPYTPSGAWHEAPPPAYQPPPGYYGWLPQHDAFTGPPPNSVFVSDNPPPYPGIGGPPPYSAQGQYVPQSHYANQPPPYNPNMQASDAPSWNGFSVPPPSEPPRQPVGQQGWGGGYQAPLAHEMWANPNVYPQGYPGYTGPSNFNVAPGGYQQGPQAQQGGFNYPPPGGPGAMGFSAPPPGIFKEEDTIGNTINTPPNAYARSNDLQPYFYDATNIYRPRPPPQ